MNFGPLLCYSLHCMLTLYFIVLFLHKGLRCLAVEFQTNCPQDYLQYGEQTCFKFFFDTQDSFDGSSRYCQDQETGQLITISNAAQLNLISTYVKLYTVLPYWVGLRYYNSSVLTDIDGTIVDAGLFNLEYQADQGDCVSVIHSSDGDVKISQMDCSQVNNFVCLKKWPGTVGVAQCNLCRHVGRRPLLEQRVHVE